MVFVRCPDVDTDDPDTDDPDTDDPDTGDTGDTDDPDTGDTGDTGEPDPFDPPDPPPSGTGCACDGGPGGAPAIALGLVALLIGRRRRAAGRRG